MSIFSFFFFFYTFKLKVVSWWATYQYLPKRTKIQHESQFFFLNDKQQNQCHLSGRRVAWQSSHSWSGYNIQDKLFPPSKINRMTPRVQTRLQQATKTPTFKSVSRESRSCVCAVASNDNYKKVSRYSKKISVIKKRWQKILQQGRAGVKCLDWGRRLTCTRCHKKKRKKQKHYFHLNPNNINPKIDSR